MPMSSQLPPEIILLVCQLLADDKHYGTLFNLALTSKANASIALEQLYSIYETSPALSGTYGKRDWAILWRSILASTQSATAYPYAAYIRMLSLGVSLDDIMSEMLNERVNRDMFCAPPLGDLLTLHDTTGTTATADGKVLRNLRGRGMGLSRIDTRTTAMSCGEAIISYIERLAGEDGVKVSLAHLELNTAPSGMLAGWCRRIGAGLVSLRLREGSVLNADVGRSVAERCPGFNDLTVFYCITEGKEGNGLAAFLNELRSDTLVRFENMSRNDLGEDDMRALAKHAGSLMSLRLRSLSWVCLKALRELTGCTNLEYFQLENDSRDRTGLVDEDPALVKELSAWFGNCRKLREFNLKHQLDTLHLMRDLVFFSNAPLETLYLQHFVLLPDGQNKAIFDSLVRHEKTLRELTIGHFWEADDMDDRSYMPFHHPETHPLINTICSLQQLRALNLQGSWLEPEIFTRIIMCSPHLEEIQVVCGDRLCDSVLDDLSTLENLKVVMILTATNFTYERMIKFGQDLDIERQNGIQVDFMNQAEEFTEEQEAKLVDLFATRLSGRLGIGYAKQRGEEGETESDSD